MHLFLYGDSGVGKTWLIRNALSRHNVRPHGFFTCKRPDGPDQSAVYFNPAAGEPEYSPSTMVARCQNRPCNWERFPQRFDCLGTKALEDLTPGAVVLMDELGFLERDALQFQSHVLAALDSPCRILGVIKEKDNEFLLRIKKHPRVKLLKVTRANQAEVSLQLDHFFAPPSLAQALEIQPGVTAIVGGGGKTTLMGRLGQELCHRGKTILCTTTHVFLPEVPFLLDPTADQVRQALEACPLLFIGARSDGRRIGPCQLVNTGEAAALADYVIAEADGSRRLPFKAPGDHEPPLPLGCGHVVAVAGMSGMGKPMETIVHRPERYCALVGKSPDQPVLPQDCARVLSHPQGQRKNVGDTPFSVVLNQAELPEGWQAAQAIVRSWNEHTVIASLKGEQPVLEVWRDHQCCW